MANPMQQMAPMPQAQPTGNPLQGGSPYDASMEDEYDESVLEGLESHLNSLPPEAKSVLAEIFGNPQTADIAQTALAIVNGQEVADYFNQVRQQLGSLPQDSQPQGGNGNPQAAPTQQPQQTATPASGNPFAATPTR